MFCINEVTKGSRFGVQRFRIQGSGFKVRSFRVQGSEDQGNLKLQPDLSNFFDILALAGGDKLRHYERSFTEQVATLTGGLSPPEN